MNKRFGEDYQYLFEYLKKLRDAYPDFLKDIITDRNLKDWRLNQRNIQKAKIDEIKNKIPKSKGNDLEGLWEKAKDEAERSKKCLSLPTISDKAMVIHGKAYNLSAEIEFHLRKENVNEAALLFRESWINIVANCQFEVLADLAGKFRFKYKDDENNLRTHLEWYYAPFRAYLLSGQFSIPGNDSAYSLIEEVAVLAGATRDVDVECLLRMMSLDYYVHLHDSGFNGAKYVLKELVREFDIERMKFLRDVNLRIPFCNSLGNAKRILEAYEEAIELHEEVRCSKPNGVLGRDYPYIGCGNIGIDIIPKDIYKALQYLRKAIKGIVELADIAEVYSYLSWIYDKVSTDAAFDREKLDGWSLECYLRCKHIVEGKRLNSPLNEFHHELINIHERH